MRTSSVIALILVALGCTVTPAPAEAAGDPSGFVYVLVDRLPNNQLYGYSADASGAFTLLPGFPITTGGLGTPTGGSQAETVVFDRVGNRLFVANVFSKMVNA